MTLKAGPCLLAILAASGPVHATTDEDVFRGIPSQATSLGARSLGMGGAFLSLADDASAVRVNPAGLAFLRRLEVSLEFRGVDAGPQLPSRGATLPPSLDVLTTTTRVHDDVDVTFDSAIMDIFDRWTLALSDSRFVKFDATTLSSFSFDFAGPNPGEFAGLSTGAMDAAGRDRAFSVGVRVSDHLAVGGTLTLSELDMDATVTNVFSDAGGNVAGSPIPVPTLDSLTRIVDKDRDYTLGLGILYKRPGTWGIGAAYRQGPRFRLTQSIMAGEDIFGTVARFGPVFGSRINLPDRWAVGANWSPIPTLTLAAGIERLTTSDQMEDFTPGVSLLTNYLSSQSGQLQFDADDRTDVHLGLETVLLRETIPPLAFRAGYRTLSDGRVHAAGDPAFPEAQTEDRVSLGFGVNLKTWKIDVGADLGDSGDEYLLSVIRQTVKPEFPEVSKKKPPRLHRRGFVLPDQDLVAAVGRRVWPADWYLDPHLRGVVNCRKRAAIRDDEYVFILIDKTKSATGKACIAFTTRGVYYNNSPRSRAPGTGFVGYDELPSLELTVEKKGIDLGNGRYIELRFSKQLLVDILTAIRGTPTTTGD